MEFPWSKIFYHVGGEAPKSIDNFELVAAQINIGVFNNMTANLLKTLLTSNDAEKKYSGHAFTDFEKKTLIPAAIFKLIKFGVLGLKGWKGNKVLTRSSVMQELLEEKEATSKLKSVLFFDSSFENLKTLKVTMNIFYMHNNFIENWGSELGEFKIFFEEILGKISLSPESFYYLIICLYLDYFLPQEDGME